MASRQNAGLLQLRPTGQGGGERDAADWTMERTNERTKLRLTCCRRARNCWAAGSGRVHRLSKQTKPKKVNETNSRNRKERKKERKRKGTK